VLKSFSYSILLVAPTREKSRSEESMKRNCCYSADSDRIKVTGFTYHNCGPSNAPWRNFSETPEPPNGSVHGLGYRLAI
jgi:hypothetical protein